MPASPTTPERDLLGRYAHVLASPPRALGELVAWGARLVGAPLVLLQQLADADAPAVLAHGGGAEPVPTRGPSPCAEVMRARGARTFDDLAAEPAFRDHPLVAGPFGARAYVGVPFALEPGRVVGTLSALSPTPGAFGARDVLVLEGLAEQAAALLRLEHERWLLACTLEHVDDGVYVQHADGRLVYANRTLARTAGFPEGFAPAGTPMPTTGGLADEHGAPLGARDLPGGRVLAGEPRQQRLVRVSAEGRERWLRFQASPVHRGEALEYAVTVVRNETEQRRAEGHLRFLAEAGALLAETLDPALAAQRLVAHVLPTLADLVSVHRFWSDGTSERLGEGSVSVRAERTLRQSPRRHVTPAGWTLGAGEGTYVRHAVDDAVLDQLATGPEHREVLRRLGMRALLVVPLVARERRVGVLHLAMLDGGRTFGPAEVRLAEELARRAALALDNAQLHAEARHALAAREELLAVVSHDLKNPLGVITLNASSLVAGSGSPELVRKKAELIQHSADQMERLVSDLLDLARLESGALRLKRSPWGADGLLTDALSLYEAAAGRAGIQLETHGLGDGTLVEADRDRLLQVFANLLSNALRFTDWGGRVRLGAERAEGAVRFSVGDSGCGIAPEDVPHVFNRFWQARDAGRREVGLGLAIAKGLVEAHGGRIWLESRPGQGTTFYFTVPRALPESAAG